MQKDYKVVFFLGGKIMATITFGKAGSRPYGVLTVTETSTSSANNTSTVSIQLVLKRPYAISSSTTKKASCTINGTTYNWSGTIGGSGDKVLISKTQTIKHNDNGDKTISIAASIGLNITWSGTYIGTISGNGTMTLTNIPRYAMVTQVLADKTETTISVNWNTNATVDYMWYSSNDGSSWTGVNIQDGTVGAFTISGLSPGTSYNIKTRVRRKDNQLVSETAAMYIVTYNWPRIKTAPDFTIGDRLTLELYNPLGRNITVNILGADGSQISNDVTTGTSITGYAGTVVVNRLYASIPNSSSGRYQVKVTYDTHIETRDGGIYKVNASQCAPVIGTVSYRDANSTSVAITGNNQDIVRNQSEVQYAAAGLAAQKSATVSRCRVSVNGNTYNLALVDGGAIGGGATIDSGTNVTATFTVTDSRGITASKSIEITMLDWNPPSAIIDMHRQNNFYTETKILVNAEYLSIGTNTVTITYKAKKTSDTQYTVTGSLQDNVQSTFNADNRYDWDVVVTLTDSFGGTTIYNLFLAKGLPIVYFDRRLSSTGFNCFPKGKNSVEVDGVNIKRTVMTRSLSAPQTDLAVNTYTIIPLDLTIATDSDRLIATDDGGIKIGENISQILVCGQMALETVTTAGRRYVRIVKNSYSAANTLGWEWENLNEGDGTSITIAPILADVSENDVIYLFYYTGTSADQIAGNGYGKRTSLTVDVVS